MTREEWLQKRTFDGSLAGWAELIEPAAAARPTVSVVIPALNVGGTVGQICRAIRETWMGPGGLVDELVVIDSSSTDDTTAMATAAGARVVQDADVLPSMGRARGKGEAMWKSLGATSGEIVVWIDGDIADFDPAFLPKLVAPLITDPDIRYVKAFYRRPLGDEPEGGGRVTEICARPLINRFFPDLAGFVQPLAGEAAGRRELLEHVPFLSGYAVEIGLLIDILAAAGLDGMAQVDLGVRRHAHQSTEELGRMAYEITHAVLCRSQGDGALTGDLRPYARPVTRDGGYALDRVPVRVVERPPMATVLAGEPGR